MKFLTILLLVIGSFANAQEVPIEEVVSVGKQPGPKLWRVTNDDRELWILGVLTPLPKKMDWDNSAVEAVMADAEAIIDPPFVGVSVNPLKAAFVLPSLWGIEKNPDKKRLEDVLPPELYQRWQVLKEMYIGRDRAIERKRPILAANELYQKAIDEVGLTPQTNVYKAIDKAAKKNKVAVVKTGVTRRLEKPRNAIKRFKKSEIEDIECFEKTLNRIEIDLGLMQARANAWAAGDVKTLRALPYEDQNVSCLEAVMSSSFAEDMADQLDLVDLEAKLRKNWLDAAVTALESNAVTFATLPMAELFKPDGYVAELAKLGYSVRGG